MILLIEDIDEKLGDDIVSLEVTSEEAHDCKILKNLVDNASTNNNVKGILADGMYDGNNNFRYLQRTTFNLI